MKKLLTLAVVACMATFAQAIQMDWTTGQNASSWMENSGATYVVYSATGTDIEAALAAYKTYTETSTQDATYTVLDGAYTSVPDDKYSALAGTINGITEAQATGTYFVFINSGTTDVYGTSIDAADTAGYWYATGSSPIAGGLTLDNDFTKVVPEPTVLALLALGVAGVALRRRRMA